MSTKPRPNSPVEYERPEYVAMKHAWRLMRCALEGETAVKDLRTEVLPMPNAADQSAENKARYEAYLCRAVWYNVTQRTIEGMVGYVFKKEPTINLPAVIAGLEDNVDGAGVSLQQQAKDALRIAIGFARGGLLVDYPQKSDATTRAEQTAGNVQPTIVLLSPEQITNWRTTIVGSKKLLTMLIVKEAAWEVGDNEFELIEVIQYRVLDIILDDTPAPVGDGAKPLGPVGTVRGRVFEMMGDGKDYIENHSLTYYPSDASGKPLTEIPFQFIGLRNNDADVERSPLEDLLTLNLAHFRNSADYEEACFMLGQPTPYVAGITEQWVTNVFKGSIQLGSRGIIPLPVGGSAGLLQCNPNTMPYEAMTHKEAQMVALGAKLVQQQKVQRTATEASMDNTSETSILVSAAVNVFLAYVQALKFACAFAGADSASLEFELSEPLTRDTLQAQDAAAIMQAWMNGLLAFEEARTIYKQSGLAYLDDEKVKTEHENALPPASLPTPGLPAKPLPAPAPKPIPAPAPAK